MSSLNYNTDLGDYQVSVTREQLEGAPKHGDENEWDWARGRRIYDY